MTVASIRRITGAIELRLGWDAGYRGSELARLRDADHAALAEATVRYLERRGWLVAAEQSFNRYGDRGRIDLLAFQPEAQTLLVIEIKTVIVEIQDLLGGLDLKAKVARDVAGLLGWQARSVVPGLIIAEGATNRRRIAEHARLFARLAIRGSAALAWLRKPTGVPPGVLIFRTSPNRSRADVRRAGRQRVRRRNAPLSVNSEAMAVSGAGISA